MKVETRRFGIVDIPDEAVITFPDGLPGFEGKLYVLIHSEEAPLVHWLQSASDPDVALMLMDPVLLHPEYTISPRINELTPIKAGDNFAEQVLCRVIVRGGDTSGELFVNLFAPILFNVPERLAMQLPLVGSPYTVREVWPRREEPQIAEAAAK